LGAPLDADHENTDGPLHVAVGADHVSIANMLIEAGANVDAIGHHGESRDRRLL
jgi:hypothetical protein